MSEEPASYQSTTAAFDLHFGSALKAILPGAFQGSVIGSLCVAGYFTVASVIDAGAFAASDIFSVVMMFCFIMMVGTLAGMIVCAVYITLIGLPLALLMRRRIATQTMLCVTLVVAILTGLGTALLMTGAVWIAPEDQWLLVAMVLCYAIPAGVAYRHAIITERLLSFWSTDAD